MARNTRLSFQQLEDRTVPDGTGWELPTWGEIRDSGQTLLGTTAPVVQQVVTTVVDRLGSSPGPIAIDSVPLIVGAVVVEQLQPVLDNAGQQISDHAQTVRERVAEALMQQSRLAHDFGAFLTEAERLQDQQRRLQNPEIYEALEHGVPPRRTDLFGRLGNSVGLTLFGGGNPLVDSTIGLLRGGAAFSESVNENLALAVLGHSDQAERQNSAFIGGYVEGSFFTQLAVGREQFDVDMIGFIREQSTGQVVTDEEFAASNRSIRS